MRSPIPSHVTKLIAATTGGNVVAQLLLAVDGMLVARLFGKWQVATFGVIAGFYLVMSAVSSGRLELAVAGQRISADRRNALETGVAVNSYFSVLLLIAVVAGIGTGTLGGWHLAVPISLMLGGGLEVSSMYHIAEGNLRLQAWIRILTAAAQLSIHGVAGIALDTASTGWLIVGFALPRALASAILLRTTGISPRLWPAMPDVQAFGLLRRAPSSFGNYLLWSTLSAGAGQVYAQGLVFASVSQYGAVRAAQLVVAVRMVSMPGQVLTRSLGQVLLTIFGQRDAANMGRSFGAINAGLGVSALALGTVTWITGRKIIQVLLGPEWAEASTFVGVLGCVVALQLWAVPQAQILTSAGRQSVVAGWHLGRLATGVGMLLMASRMQLDLQDLVSVYALHATASYGCLVVLAWRCSVLIGEPRELDPTLG